MTHSSTASTGASGTSSSSEDMRGKDDENKSVQQQAKTSVSNPKGYIQQQSHQQPQQASSYHNLLPLSSNNPQNMVVFQPNVPIVRSQSETKIIEAISMNDFEQKEILGKGSYGLVIRASLKATGKDVAIKFFQTEIERDAFTVECKQLSRLDHPNIVKLFGASTSAPYFYLVMEFAECGSLYKILHQIKPIEKLPYHSGHAFTWAYQCAKGIEYIHNLQPKPLIHRDLKSPNLLVFNRGLVLKICDFGTACDKQTIMTNNRGSAAWMAPEVFESFRYTEKCDIFSWGIILWEILTRRLPFEEIGGNDLRVLWAIHQGQRPPLVAGCPEVLEDLMERCWHKDTNERPTSSELVEELDFLSGFFPSVENDPLNFPPDFFTGLKPEDQQKSKGGPGVAESTSDVEEVSVISGAYASAVTSQMTRSEVRNNSSSLELKTVNDLDQVDELNENGKHQPPALLTSQSYPNDNTTNINDDKENRSSKTNPRDVPMLGGGREPAATIHDLSMVKRRNHEVPSPDSGAINKGQRRILQGSRTMINQKAYWTPPEESAEFRLPELQPLDPNLVSKAPPDLLRGSQQPKPLKDAWTEEDSGPIPSDIQVVRSDDNTNKNSNSHSPRQQFYGGPQLFINGPDGLIHQGDPSFFGMRMASSPYHHPHHPQGYDPYASHRYPLGDYLPQPQQQPQQSGQVGGGGPAGISPGAPGVSPNAGARSLRQSTSADQMSEIYLHPGGGGAAGLQRSPSAISGAGSANSNISHGRYQPPTAAQGYQFSRGWINPIGSVFHAPGQGGATSEEDWRRRAEQSSEAGAPHWTSEFAPPEYTGLAGGGGVNTGLSNHSQRPSQQQQHQTSTSNNFLSPLLNQPPFYGFQSGGGAIPRTAGGQRGQRPRSADINQLFPVREADYPPSSQGSSAAGGGREGETTANPSVPFRKGHRRSSSYGSSSDKQYPLPGVHHPGLVGGGGGAGGLPPHLSSMYPPQQQQHPGMYASSSYGQQLPPQMQAYPPQYQFFQQPPYYGQQPPYYRDPTDDGTNPNHPNFRRSFSNLYLGDYLPQQQQHPQQRPPSSTDFDNMMYGTHARDAYLDRQIEQLNPDFRPVPPQPNCPQSMQIYEDHRMLAAEYLTIKHETAKLQRYKEDLQKRLAETEAEEEEAPSQEDIEAVIKLQNEKEALQQFQDKLTTQLQLIKRAKQGEQLDTAVSNSPLQQQPNQLQASASGGASPSSSNRPTVNVHLKPDTSLSPSLRTPPSKVDGEWVLVSQNQTQQSSSTKNSNNSNNDLDQS